MTRIEVGEIPPSLNKYYSGLHWTKRKAITDEWHLLFLAAFRKAKLPKPLAYPITLHVVEFCKRLRDSDAAVMASKFCGDALVKYGYLPDDNPNYIRSVILQSRKGKEDKTVILILNGNVCTDTDF